MKHADLVEVATARLDRPVPPLALRLVRSHGDAKDGVAFIPASGAGVAAALELGGERMSDAQWRAANLCRIAWKGRGWQLLNASPTLVCAVNGERVIPHVPIAVCAGDALEIGLLSFDVQSEGNKNAEPLAPSIPLAGIPGQPASAQTPSLAQNDASEFDLRDLAFAEDNDCSSCQADRLDDPFGVLDIPGAERRSAGDPLAELLGDIPPRPTSPFGPAGNPQAAVQAMQGVDMALQFATAQAAERRTGASSALIDARANATTHLFDNLHEEFVRVVRDPAQLTGRASWEDAVDHGDQTPTLEDLSREAKPYALLRDILLPREGIDQVIAEFDPLSRSTLLDESETEDVLRLFAPTLARNAKALVPALTRREHHDLSPDSHMDPGAFRSKSSES